ncbi:unnamed protein product, partial [Scytosiphon promiscuus]
LLVPSPRPYCQCCCCAHQIPVKIIPAAAGTTSEGQVLSALDNESTTRRLKSSTGTRVCRRSDFVQSAARFEGVATGARSARSRSKMTISPRRKRRLPHPTVVPAVVMIASTATAAPEASAGAGWAAAMAALAHRGTPAFASVATGARGGTSTDAERGP